MGWKKIGRGLAKVAPIAARVATSGLLGDGVVRSLTDALGLDSGASEDDVEAALAKASPEQLARIRQIEAETERHAADVRYKTAELVVREEEVHAADRDSARKREMAVRDPTPSVLVYSTIGLFAALSVALLFVTVPDHSRMLLGGLVGILGGEVARQGAYYFGSSRGSKDKSAQLAARDDVIQRGLAAARVR